MAGRRPKPLAIHRLNGNPSMMSKADLEGADDVQTEVEAPEMPRGLSRAGRREWKRIVRDLLEIGCVSKVDGKALAAYCDCFARWEEARKLIDKYGQVIETTFMSKDGELIVGDLKANPACGLADKWLGRMKSYLIEFGLTPASRRNLKLTKRASADPMEQFLNRKKPQGESKPLLTPVAPDAMSAGDDVN